MKSATITLSYLLWITWQETCTIRLPNNHIGINNSVGVVKIFIQYFLNL